MDKPPVNPLIPKLAESGPLNDNQGHRNSDVDSSQKAQHHTLGTGANQASFGNHTHDGKDSKVIDLFADSSNLLPWTPIWFSTAASQPAIGNGILDGSYVRQGMFCYLTFRWYVGSTTTFGGAGQYYFSIPFLPAPGAGLFNALSGTMKNGNFQWPITSWIAYGPGGINEDRINRLTPGSAKTEGMPTISISNTGWKTAWATDDFIIMSGMMIVDLARSPL